MVIFETDLLELQTESEHISLHVDMETVYKRNR